MPVDIGDTAPDITTTADDGHPFTLSDRRGQRVVLYFYSRADTAG